METIEIDSIGDLVLDPELCDTFQGLCDCQGCDGGSHSYLLSAKLLWHLKTRQEIGPLISPNKQIQKPSISRTDRISLFPLVNKHPCLLCTRLGARLEF